MIINILKISKIYKSNQPTVKKVGKKMRSINLEIEIRVETLL